MKDDKKIKRKNRKMQNAFSKLEMDRVHLSITIAVD